MMLTIPANDHGKIRVFALSSPPAPALANKEPAAIAQVFGTDALNLDFVDVVDIAATENLGLLGLIEQGYGFTPDEADKAALAHLSGWVILIMSRATEGEVTLRPAPFVTHVTTLGENAMLTIQKPLDSEAAKGTLEPPTKPAKSDARVGGMIATLALVFLFLLVGAMIWIGG